MRRNWFFILLSLAERERHGSEVMRDVRELTDGELTLWPATLYGSLDELSEQEWIEELSDPEVRPTGESERKRYYRITAAGRAALRKETGRLESLAQTARLRLSRAR